MRDGIALAKAGHPVVVMVEDKFERAARAQAKVLGVPELDIYVYVHPKAGEMESVKLTKVLQAAAELPRMLKHSK